MIGFSPLSSEAIGANSAAQSSHVLVGAASAQENASGIAAIIQRHQLAGANSGQANASSTAELGQQQHILSGSASIQASGSTSGAIIQRHIISGAGSNQPNLSPGAIVNPLPFKPSPRRTLRFIAEDRRFVFAPEDRAIKFNA
jgi:hypothetical protein